MLSAAWIVRRSVSVRGWAVGERPILFSGEMVRAILDGRKTVTRREVKLPRARDSFVLVEHGDGWWPYQSDDGESHVCSDGMERPYNCPYGQPGDQLWVRESWCPIYRQGNPELGVIEVDYRATPRERMCDLDGSRRWKPSIHMPRSASRIQLEVTAVHVERLQDISEEQAQAEGVSPVRVKVKKLSALVHRAGFFYLWERINGIGSWDANPWVWVVEFKVIKGAQHG